MLHFDRSTKSYIYCGVTINCILDSIFERYNSFATAKANIYIECKSMLFDKLKIVKL